MPRYIGITARPPRTFGSPWWNAGTSHGDARRTHGKDPFGTAGLFDGERDQRVTGTGIRCFCTIGRCCR